MAASSEIRFKIGADTSALSRGIVQAQSIAAVGGKAMRKHLDIKEAFGRTVLALGLSIENIATRVANFFSGGSMEGFNSALSAAQQTAKILEDASFERLNTLKQIAALEARIAQNRGAENAEPRKEGTLSGWRKLMFDSPGGREVMRRLGLGGETDDEAIARSQTAIGQRTLDESRKAALQEKERRAKERIAQARRELASTGFEGPEKIAAALKEAEVAGERLSVAQRKGAETAELELDFVNKLKSAKQTIFDVEKQMTEEAQRRERMQADQREKILGDYREYLEAQREFNDAKAQGAAARPFTALEQAWHHKLALMNGEVGAGADNVFDPRHTFGPGEQASAPTPWDLKFGGAIASRGAAMDKAIAARNESITTGVRARNVALLGMPSQEPASNLNPPDGSKLDQAADKLSAAADQIKRAMTVKLVKD